MRDEPPGGAGTDHPAQGIEDITQIMPALAGIQGKQRQIGRNKAPFLIADIGRARFALEFVQTRFDFSNSSRVYLSLIHI